MQEDAAKKANSSKMELAVVRQHSQLERTECFTDQIDAR